MCWPRCEQTGITKFGQHKYKCWGYEYYDLFDIAHAIIFLSKSAPSTGSKATVEYFASLRVAIVYTSMIDRL